jgi:regulation of enolase protein 1 (concanavalin A-like superfamily)
MTPLRRLVALALVVGCGGSNPASPGDGAAGHAGGAGGTAGQAGTGDAGSGGAGTGSAGAGGAGTGVAGAGGDVATDGGGAGTGDGPDNLPPLKADGPWLVRDVGDLGTGTAHGSLTPSSAVFTVRGTGAGVGGAADAFFFAYQHVTGDGEIVARVQSLLKVSPAAQVGIMVRADDVDAGAANVFLAVDGDGAGGHLRARAARGAAESALADGTLKEGRLLRLARTGKVVTAYRDDGAGGWTQVGVVEADLPDDVVVGLAATDGAAGSVASAAFDVARVGSLDADAATKGWALSELGTVGGSAIVAGGTLTVAGLGERTSPTSDVGVFFQQSMSGAHTITAKVVELQGATPDARLGLMVREGAPGAPKAGAAYAFMSVTKGQGAQFGNRSKAGGNAQAGAGMSGIAAPVWLRLEKLDAIDGATSTFTGFVSSDGTTWNVLDSLTFPLQQPYSIGVFLLSGSVTTFSAARLTDISVTSPK